jgi:hypothetical protein
MYLIILFYIFESLYTYLRQESSYSTVLSFYCRMNIFSRSLPPKNSKNSFVSTVFHIFRYSSPTISIEVLNPGHCLAEVSTSSPESVYLDEYKGTVSPDFVFYFRLYKFKSLLSARQHGF